jgi:hypothetical protein
MVIVERVETTIQHNKVINNSMPVGIHVSLTIYRLIQIGNTN